MRAERSSRNHVEEACGTVKIMDVSERRLIGALLLLLGVSFFAVGVYTNQLNALIQLLKTVFRL
jgi:hypothetical protein